METPNTKETPGGADARDCVPRLVRQYKDVAGNPCSLEWLVRNEPEWAANQIRHRDKLDAENRKLREVVERALPFVERWYGAMEKAKLPLLDDMREILSNVEAWREDQPKK